MLVSCATAKLKATTQLKYIVPRKYSTLSEEKFARSLANFHCQQTDRQIDIHWNFVLSPLCVSPVDYDEFRHNIVKVDVETSLMML